MKKNTNQKIIRLIDAYKESSRKLNNYIFMIAIKKPTDEKSISLLTGKHEIFSNL